MRRDEVIRILRGNADRLRREGVVHVSLFGSVARDDARADSDVDIVVETTPERPVTLLTIGPLHDLFAALLGRPVDIIDKKGFERAVDLQARVSGQLVHVF